MGEVDGAARLPGGHREVDGGVLEPVGHRAEPALLQPVEDLVEARLIGRARVEPGADGPGDDVGRSGIGLDAADGGQTSTAELLNAFALPLFATGFLVGMVVRWGLRVTGGSRFVDQATMKSLSGAASDVLIVCAMVSIEPTFVRDHLGSLILIFILGITFCVFLGLVVAPRYLGRHWFEKQIFTWGWATGSVATGITLLRIVDPDLDSGTVEDFGYAYLPLIPIEGAAVAVAPLLVIAGASWTVALIWGLLTLGGVWILMRNKQTAMVSS